MYTRTVFHTYRLLFIARLVDNVADRVKDDGCNKPNTLIYNKCAEDVT